jgi:hypothetical protein
MHGTEHRNQTRGAPRLSAPQRTFSPSAGSMPPGAPPAVARSGPVARNGLSLTRNSCSLSEPPFRGRSSWPATSLPYRPSTPPVRIFGSTPLLVCSRERRFHSLNPVAAPPRGSPGCSDGLHSPPGLLGPSGSTRSTASAASRPAFRIRPISSRSPQPCLSLELQLRIIVPGPLRFRRLAVPQTSWNLIQYAPNYQFRQ